jgi:hypothetical protein
LRAGCLPARRRRSRFGAPFRFTGQSWLPRALRANSQSRPGGYGGCRSSPAAGARAVLRRYRGRTCRWSATGPAGRCVEASALPQAVRREGWFPPISAERGCSLWLRQRGALRDFWSVDRFLRLMAACYYPRPLSRGSAAIHVKLDKLIRVSRATKGLEQLADQELAEIAAPEKPPRSPQNERNAKHKLKVIDGGG